MGMSSFASRSWSWARPYISASSWRSIVPNARSILSIIMLDNVDLLPPGHEHPAGDMFLQPMPLGRVMECISDDLVRGAFEPPFLEESRESPYDLVDRSIGHIIRSSHLN